MAKTAAPRTHTLWAQEGCRHGTGLDRGRDHQRAALADPRRQRPRGQGPRQLAHAEEGDGQGRGADRRPELAGAERQHRQDGTVAE